MYGGRKGSGWDQIFLDKSPDLMDFIIKCVAFNPKERIRAENALDHPFLASPKTEFGGKEMERKKKRKVSSYRSGKDFQPIIEKQLKLKRKRRRPTYLLFRQILIGSQDHQSPLKGISFDILGYLFSILFLLIGV